ARRGTSKRFRVSFSFLLQETGPPATPSGRRKGPHRPAMDRRTARPLVTLAAGLLTLAGGACASAPPSSTTGVTVVASFYPLAEAARRVGGATVAVDNLTPPGVEPHDLELSPKE